MPVAESQAIKTPQTTIMEGVYDPVAVVKALDDACNAGDLDRVMTFFADDAVLKDSLEPMVHAGRRRIREWYRQQLRHFHVVSANHQVTGDTVTWQGTAAADTLRQSGIAYLDEMGAAVVRGGRITFLELTLIDAAPEVPVKVQ